MRRIREGEPYPFRLHTSVSIQVNLAYDGLYLALAWGTPPSAEQMEHLTHAPVRMGYHLVTEPSAPATLLLLVQVGGYLGLAPVLPLNTEEQDASAFVRWNVMVPCLRFSAVNRPSGTVWRTRELCFDRDWYDQLRRAVAEAQRRPWEDPIQRRRYLRGFFAAHPIRELWLDAQRTTLTTSDDTTTGS